LPFLYALLVKRLNYLLLLNLLLLPLLNWSRVDPLSLIRFAVMQWGCLCWIQL